jgi:hypothetical protein
MARFLADMVFQVIADEKLAQPFLKTALDSTELPEGITILNVEKPYESIKENIHTIRVPIDVKTPNENFYEFPLDEIRQSIKTHNIILIRVNMLGVVHDE